MYMIELSGEDFPGGSDGSVCLQCGKPGFDPWVRKIPWRRKWQPIPGLLPGKSQGWRSLVGSVHGVAKRRTQLSDFTFTLWHFLTLFIFSVLSSYLPIMPSPIIIMLSRVSQISRHCHPPISYPYLALSSFPLIRFPETSSPSNYSFSLPFSKFPKVLCP